MIIVPRDVATANKAEDVNRRRLLIISSPLRLAGWRGLLSWLIAAGLIVWLLTQVDLPTVRNSLRVNYSGWLLSALLSVVATVFLRVARWRALLMNPTGSHLTWATLGRATLWGQGLNMLLPFRAGDLARAHNVRGAEQVGAAYALGTIGAEKLLDLVWLSAAFLLLLFKVRPDLPVVLPVFRLWIPLLVLSGALAAAWLSRRMSLFGGSELVQRQPLSTSLQRLAAGLNVLSRPTTLGIAMAWSVPLWLGHVFTNYATARAMALPMDWAGALLVLVVLQVGLAPPSTPAKVGVFQALCVAALSLLGHNLGVGLAYSILLQLVVMLPPLLLLLFFVSLGQLN